MLALLAFAADAGPFAALGGQHAGVAGAGITPAQVVLQPASQDVMVRVVRAAHDKGPQRPEARLGLAHDALVGVTYNPVFSRRAQERMP